MKKLSLLLASIGAGLLLVGGTVALNIVTSASPIGVQISPGNIQTDESHRIVLSWGKNTTAPVGNLVPEIETNVGEVELASSEAGASVNYTGIFTAAMADQSDYTGSTPLSNYITINAYKYESSAYVTTPTFSLTSSHMSESRAGTTGDAYLLKVTLTADPKASYYNDLLSQQITLTLGWGKASGDTDISQVANVYFAKPSTWVGEDVYVYAYKDGNVLTTYPGLKMTYEYDIEGNKALYSAAFNRDKYDHFIFNNGTHATDVEATHAFVENEPTPYYNGTSWAAKPLEVVYTYYARGDFNEYGNQWSNDVKALALKNSVAHDTDTQYKTDVLTVAEGDAFKVKFKCQSEEEGWYGSANFVITKDIIDTYGTQVEIWYSSGKLEASETPEQTGGWGWWDHGLGVHFVTE